MMKRAGTGKGCLNSGGREVRREEGSEGGRQVSLGVIVQGQVDIPHLPILLGKVAQVLRPTNPSQGQLQKVKGVSEHGPFGRQQSLGFV